MESFRLTFNADSESLADMLGFVSQTTDDLNPDWKNSVNGSYVISAGNNSAVTNYLSGVKAVQLSGPSVLSIRSPSVRNTSRSHDYKFSTLLNIPTKSLRGQSTLYNNPNPTPVAINSQSISQFELRLTLGRRTRYWSKELNRFVPFLSLNRTGFQVVIRLYMEDGPGQK